MVVFGRFGSLLTIGTEHNHNGPERYIMTYRPVKQLFEKPITIYDLGRDDIKPGQVVFESLYLCNQPLTELPKGLIVEGWFDLFGASAMTRLPQGLIVRGWLDIRRTSITSLPKGLMVEGTIYKDF